ncbi:MAG TPA: MBL fold metallo-hydrolase [Gemmatimonadaceae bacterium]|nr:MBL fold metallo-hydrolase [Gemmatimonadaceae bacterium]
MLLERFYDTALAQASYLIGCQATGDAIVVDPTRDIEPYLAFARARSLRIAQVTETHIHADFLSGARALAEAAGAQLLLSGEGGAGWQYAFARDAGARLLHDGDTLTVGNVRLDVLHTPGHTPEHLVFVVTDTPATARPMGALTGDFVFVGDVGRPDLLERAAGVANTMEAGARALWRSIQRFAALPDYLQIWPGHGAGSACGKSLGAVPFSTLGYETIANWAFAIADEDAFVREVLAGQPEPPRYFAEMKRLNRDAQPRDGAHRVPSALPADSIAGALESGTVVIDVRPTAAFGSGHVPGSLNLPLGDSFVGWAGWFVPYDRDLVLLAETEERAAGAASALARIGLDRVRGWVDASALEAWRRSNGTLQSVSQLSARELAARRAEGAGAPRVIDVRSRAEWAEGHIPGVENVPQGLVPEHLATLDRDTPLVLQCRSGSRSAVVAGVLQAQGFTNVVNLKGGIRGWMEAGLEVER